MTRTVHATFDGEVLRPEEPLELEPNTRVVVTIEVPKGEPGLFLRTARSLNLEGPPDWSEKFEEYLHRGKVRGDE